MIEVLSFAVRSLLITQTHRGIKMAGLSMECPPRRERERDRERERERDKELEE